MYYITIYDRPTLYYGSDKKTRAQLLNRRLVIYRVLLAEESFVVINFALSVVFKLSTRAQ